jgi:dolichyl-phosphate-mannose-protein mannosyltransferase
MSKRYTAFLIMSALLIALCFFMNNSFESLFAFCAAGILFCVFFCIFFFKNENSLTGGFDEKYEIAFLIWLVGASIALHIKLMNMSLYHESDMYCFTGWASLAYNGGLKNFYSGEYFTDYPPVYIYVLYVLGGIKSAFESIDYAFLVRVPALLCDIILGIFVYFFAKKHSGEKCALILTAFVLLNPCVMINSSVWGQIDIIYTLLTVICIVLAYKNSFMWGIVIFCVSALLKPQTVMAAPALLFCALDGILNKQARKQTLVQCLVGIALGIIVCILLAMPFTDQNPITFIKENLTNGISGHGYMSMNGYNLYALLGLNWVSTISGFENMLYISFGILSAFAGYYFFKIKAKNAVFTCGAFVTYGVYIFSCAMHERYIFIVPLLLIFGYVLQKDKKLLIAAAIVFASSVFDHTVSLYYYGLYVPGFFTTLLSAINIGGFLYLLWVMFGHVKKSKKIAGNE